MGDRIHSHGHDAGVNRQGGAATSAVHVDPVCGMQVAEGAGQAYDHQGTKYHFCGAGCKAKFKEHPAKYLKPLPSIARRWRN
jgi:Cu+-exporting ATPase